MTQQLQQYPQYGGGQYQAQTPMGQQIQSSQFGQAVGRRFQESVPQEVVAVVEDLDRLATVCEWAHMKTMERGRPRVARACLDLADIAELEKKLVLRQSSFAQPIGEATRQVIQSAVQELQQHASEPEVQEALSHAQQTAGRIQQALSRIQQFGGQGGTGGQPGQMGQPMGQSTGQGFGGSMGQQSGQYGAGQHGQPTGQGFGGSNW